jgi:hypothetical protein
MTKNPALLFLIVSFTISTTSHAQVHSFDAGLRFQKSIGLYLENGLTAQYNLTTRWVLGATYITSRLGTAMGSNAIKQDNIFVSGAYQFRPTHVLQPFVRASLGYFTADYEAPVFKILPNSSAIVALEGGVSYTFKSPFKTNLSIGYNLISGDGETGAGTLYPVFYQASVTYNLSKLFSK